MSASPVDFEQLLGEEFGPFLGWDKVNAPMIRHWCEALGDKNPIYTDPEAARAAGHIDKGQGVVAPPTMMQAWNMGGFGTTGPPGSETRNPFEVITTLREAGYPSTVAVNSEQDYERVVVEGDSIRHRARLEHISEEKTTALGTGFFITQLCTYYNQRDEVVGRMRWRVLQYRPHGPGGTAGGGEAAAELPRAMRRMRPVRNHDNAHFWEGVDMGELRLQRCGSCGALRHPPGPMCPHCQSLDWEVAAVSGRAELYSYVVMHYPEIPPFDYPHIIALASLEEGPRLVASLVGVKRRDVRIGMALRTVFEEVEEGLTLPQFRPAPVAES